MPSEFLLQLPAATPFRTLDNGPNAIWTYSLSWPGPSNRRSPTRGVHQAGDFGARVALEFSYRIDIRDPGQFTNVPEIQATRLERPTQVDVQYVYREFQSPPTSPIIFAFIAPADKDSFCPVKLVHKLAVDSPWADLAFKTAVEGDVALQHVVSGPAIICPSVSPPVPPGLPVNLSSETRRVPKCTYVPLNLPEGTTDDSRAFVKFAFVRNLALQPGEVEAIRREIPTSDNSQLRILRAFEGSPVPSPNALAAIPVPVLRALGKAVISHRRQAVDQLHQNTHSHAARSTTPIVDPKSSPTRFIDAAAVALNGFEANITATPIGMLNLERLEMTPVGIERGALIATIPLAPLEKTAVVHKEWSVTTKEFTSIVTDSLENFSETGVTENTELATATTSQTTHSNQFNINGTVSGTYGLVSAMVASSFTAQDQNSNSANESRKHAIATTRKASSRVKQEHKVTISTTTVTGSSETSTRMLENQSTTNPIRIDYFSMMRKWHVGLYRYGLRLTYDIAIPEPGAAMREIYAQIAVLQAKIVPFEFSIPYSEITTDLRLPNETEPHYLVLAERYSAQVPSPPGPGPTLTPNASFPVTAGIHQFQLAFDVPTGYSITSVTLDAHVTGPATIFFDFEVLGTTFQKIRQPDQTFPSTLLISRKDGSNFLEHGEGSKTVTFHFFDATSAMVELTIETRLTDQLIQQWQQGVWNALYNAAQTQYYAQQQSLVAQISQFQDSINNVDTLTLRREENEEIMKGVLRWLLGPAFDFMPGNVTQIFTDQHADVEHGVAFTGSEFGDAAIWPTMFAYEEMVKFINEAIEWENVLYFLYSYFWDVPESWDFIRQIRHPDAIRQAFLRAGSSRVVLTVRSGWEAAWVSFVETGGFGATLLPGHPYMSVASEIENYDRTNYPGIPPANLGGGPLADSGAAVATQSGESLTTNAGPVTIKVDSSAGFIVGYTAVLDSYDVKLPGGGQAITAQENQTITAVPDATHITVERLNNPHDGSKKPFAVMQGGEKGQLIAEWFEYTPSSGTDIAVTSNLATIS